MSLHLRRLKMSRHTLPWRWSDNEFSFVVTDNASLEHDSVDGLMQEDTELTKVGGSSADEPAI
ncbi:hypothetical protein Tco_0376944, partial [Tanacetum coccineum]